VKSLARFSREASGGRDREGNELVPDCVDCEHNRDVERVVRKAGLQQTLYVVLRGGRRSKDLNLRLSLRGFAAWAVAAAIQVVTGEKLQFEAPRFEVCTGFPGVPGFGGGVSEAVSS